MKLSTATKTLCASGAALAIMAGLGVVSHNDVQSNITSFTPAILAQSLCGQNTDSVKARRTYFISAGSAIAAQTPSDAAIDTSVLTPIAGISYEVSANPEAQALFDAGLAQSWNFNHGAAVKIFKAAQAADPDCAMCYWGEAFAWGPNINAPMGPEAVAPAYGAIKKAQALKENTTEKERILIDALAARYAKSPPADRAPLDAAFADAMDAAAKQFPDDDFIVSLAAEAMMDTQPWDYWEVDGRTPKGRSARVLELVEIVLERNPDYHPAIHLYIHITEATSNPYRAAPYADRLDDLSPTLGHLIHMPSHIYYRIGRFKEAIDLNIEAVKADENFIATGEASTLYEFGYYVHNLHFVMMASMMVGDKATALEMSQKLDARLPTDMALAVPFAQPIKAAPYYAMAQFGEPEDALALEQPDQSAPFLVAIHAYAQGEALVKLGRLDEAQAKADEIFDLHAKADFSGLIAAGIPAHDILELAGLTVSARIDAARDNLDSAIAKMESAVAIQDVIAYTEPPYWYYPAKQTLAAFVLESGDAERAEHLFLDALVKSPNNGWVYYGLSEAYGAQGKKSAKKYALKMMKDAWSGKSKPSLKAL